MAPPGFPKLSGEGHCARGRWRAVLLRRHRLPQEQWWLNLRLMLKMLANYQISLTEYISGKMEHVTRRTLSIEKGF